MESFYKMFRVRGGAGGGTGGGAGVFGAAFPEVPPTSSTSASMYLSQKIRNPNFAKAARVGLGVNPLWWATFASHSHAWIRSGSRRNCTSLPGVFLAGIGWEKRLEGGISYGLGLKAIIEWRPSFLKLLRLVRALEVLYCC